MKLTDWINFKNSNFRTSFSLFVLVSVLGFTLVVVNAKLLPVLFLLMGSVLFLLDKKMLLVLLYVIYLPTNGLINREDFLLGVLGVQQILGLFAIASLLKIKSKTEMTDFQKIAGRLMIILLCYICYTFLKNAFFGLMGADWTDALKKIFNVFIVYGPLLLILRKCSSDTFKGWIAMALFLGVLNQALFCFLSPFLPELGFYSQGTDTFFSSEEVENVSRYAGIMGNGDSNTLGTFFVIAIGFYLSHPRSFSSSSLIKVLCGVCVVAIALTSSRTAFITLAFIGMLFLAKRGSGKMKLQFIIGAILIAAISSPLWDTLLERLSGAGSEQLNTDTSSNRIGKWLLYFDHFFNHPTTFLYGSSQTIFIGFNDIFLAAHNFYIQVIYNSGLVFLGLFFREYVHIFRLMKNNVAEYSLAFIIIPFFAITFFVSDFGVFMYLSLFLALNTIRTNLRAQVSLHS